MAITHNLDSLIKRLNVIEKAYLPDAAKAALKSFGFEARDILKKEMKEKYGSVTPFTERSPYFKIKDGGYGLVIGINDKANGTAPNRYLAPTDRTDGGGAKEIAPTSFAGALRRRYGLDEIPVPVKSSRAGRQFIDKRGNVKPRKVKTLLNYLKSPDNAALERYFLVPQKKGRLSPGIYRRYRVKNQLSMAFKLPATTPKQKPVLDFHGVIRKAAEEQLPELIQRKLRKLLR